MCHLSSDLVMQNTWPWSHQSLDHPYSCRALQDRFLATGSVCSGNGEFLMITCFWALLVTMRHQEGNVLLLLLLIPGFFFSLFSKSLDAHHSCGWGLCLGCADVSAGTSKPQGFLARVFLLHSVQHALNKELNQNDSFPLFSLSYNSWNYAGISKWIKHVVGICNVATAWLCISKQWQWK